MAKVVLVERPDSRRWTVGENSTFERKYNATGSSNHTTIRDKATSEIPLAWEGLYRSNIDIEPNPEHLDAVSGRGLWLVTAHYLPAVLGLYGESFDTKGGTSTVKQSLSTRSRTSTSPPATFHDRAVNVRDGVVEGTEITVPVFTWNESYEMQSHVVTPGYKGTLYKLTGKVNEKPFRIFGAEEVLFLGASGTKNKETGIYDMEFHFAASPELKNFSMGSLTIPLKRGWDYLWVVYETRLDDGSHQFAQVPKEVYVEQMYETADFSKLRIGVQQIPVSPG